MEMDEELLGELIHIFAQDKVPDETARAKAKECMELKGAALYPELLFNLVHIQFQPEEAHRIWQAILKHKYLISERLQRNIGIRVAAMDYFLNIQPRLEHPRVIDSEHYATLVDFAEKDGLTDLYNYRSYKKKIQEECARTQRVQSFFCLCLFDIDNFKEFNDTYGHLLGDEILLTMGGIMREQIREIDSAFRYGGEEFALILVQTDKNSALVVAERIRKKVAENFKDIGVTISGGIAVCPRDASSPRELFSFADRALHRAKGKGKNQIVLFPYERRKFARK